MQNHNIFTSFSSQKNRQFFSWNQSCQQLKSPKPQHFHEFSPKQFDNFSREIKVEFLDKKWRFRTVCNLLISLPRIIYAYLVLPTFLLSCSQKSFRNRNLVIDNLSHLKKNKKSTLDLHWFEKNLGNLLWCTLFQIFIFCPKIQLWFPEKIVDFLGWKTRENVVVLDFLAVDNFDFTRKSVKKIWVKNSWKCWGLSKLDFWTKIWLFE